MNEQKFSNDENLTSNDPTMNQTNDIRHVTCVNKVKE